MQPIFSRENKTAWKSEFSMGQFDFERFHEIKKYLDALAQKVLLYNQESLDMLDEYWATLHVLFIDLYAPMMDQQRKLLDEAFKTGRELIQKSKKESSTSRVNIEAHNHLRDIHRELNIFMQFCGLGIVLGRDHSDSEKLDKALGLKRDKTPG